MDTESAFRDQLRADRDRLWREGMAAWLIAIAEQVRVGEARITNVEAFTEIPERPGVYAMTLTIEDEKIVSEE